MKKYVTEIAKRKDLIVYLTLSGLKAQHKNSFLGYFWWLLDPFLNVLIYYTVVVVIFHRADSADFGPYLVVGMIIWRWLHTTIAFASPSIHSHANIINQVNLPYSIFPLGSSLTQLINFGFGVLVILIFLLFFGITPTWKVLWLLPIIIIQLGFQTALALAISYISVFVRDIDNIIGHMLRLWFFGSPIIWYEQMIPERARWLVSINPMTHFLRCYRDVLLHNRTPDVVIVGLIGICSALTIVGMIEFYRRHEYRIVKAL
jgi:ABC-type polysaccharide/polyol phosphate export permease